ncbi:MAG: HDOD domain-containing protein [Planctomycetaceae bacterium]|nr:HDOD domain-containing protein [Planctomycetaceae bacterium]
MKVTRELELPSLPTAAMRMLRMMSEPEFGISDMTEIIRADPALTAKLLKVANSADSGSARRVTDLSRAVVMIGMRKVTAIALSFSLSNESMRSGAYQKWYAHFWFRSLVVALAAEIVAREFTDVLLSDAFVTGLLCHVGHLAALNEFPEYYAASQLELEDPAMRDDCPTVPDGRSARELTLAMASKWNLPPDSVNAMRTGEAEDATRSELRRIIQVAEAFGDFFDGTNRPQALARIDSLLCEEMGVAEQKLHGVLSHIRHQLGEYEDLFNLDLEELMSAAEMLAEAKDYLSSLVFNEAAGARRPSNAALERRVVNWLDLRERPGQFPAAMFVFRIEGTGAPVDLAEWFNQTMREKMPLSIRQEIELHVLENEQLLLLIWCSSEQAFTELGWQLWDALRTNPISEQGASFHCLGTLCTMCGRDPNARSSFLESVASMTDRAHPKAGAHNMEFWVTP